VSELLVVILGFAGGILAGLFGVGGGILFVPTLVLVLGLTQVHAEATSLLAILPTVQSRHGNVDWRTALLIGLGSVVGVEGGVQIAKALPEGTLRRLFAVFMLLVAASIAWRALRPESTYPSSDDRP